MSVSDWPCITYIGLALDYAFDLLFLFITLSVFFRFLGLANILKHNHLNGTFGCK